MENEVARCIAEGIAEKTLDALEKKVKRLWQRNRNLFPEV